MEQNKKGISLITLIITIVVIIILAAAIIIALTDSNVSQNADRAVFENDISVMQDLLNVALSDITLNEKEVPVLYTDETYNEKVTDRVWINAEKEEIGIVYYKTSKKKFCIIFGKEEQAKVNNNIEVASIENVGISQIEYIYTNQELATHKGMELHWYVTHDNRIVLDEGMKINEPGTYKMTVNAGSEADWLGLIVNNLVVPEGASVEYSFETSNDLETWNEAVDNINNAVNSQYLRVKLTLVPNEKGESPSLTSIRVLFNIGGDIIKEPVYDDKYQEVYYQGQKMYLSIEKDAVISQVIRINNKEIINDVSVPIVYNGSMHYLTLSSQSTGSVVSIKMYGSSNGVDWEEVSSTSGHEYIKVETTAHKKDVMVGEVQVNTTIKALEMEWITTNTEYYEADAGDVGNWISIETDEQIPEGTRILYSFTKSNDGEKWTSYSEDITDNGNSRYIKVKVEYQKLSEGVSKNAVLNELVINYNVNGVENQKRLVYQRPDPPIEIVHTVNDTVISITTKVDDENKISGVQYKVNDGEWSEKIYAIDEALDIDVGSATSLWVAVRCVSIDEKTFSNPIQKTIELEGLVEFLAEPAKEWTNGNVKVVLGYFGKAEGYILQYKLGSGEWNEYSETLEIKENITIIARMYNEELDDEIAVNSKTISNIDKIPPTIPNTFDFYVENSQVVVKASGSRDEESGIAGYQYKLGDGEWSQTQLEDVTYIIPERVNAGLTYKVCVRAIDKAGVTSEEFNGTITTKTTLHVSINGDDSNADGSEEHPYATLSAAVTASVDGNAIHIGEGEYTLTPINEAGLDDRGKALEIYGENEKTILKYKGSTTTGRDGPAVQISNKNTIVRNLTYIFEPKNSTTNYNVPIFKYSKGSVKNVFFRIITRKASHTYYQCTPIVENCTFYHDMGSVYGNYDGTASFINIATNVTTQGANTNVITDDRYARQNFTTSQLIQVSKDNIEFNNNKVGVFYGDYAWNNYEEIDFTYNPDDYVIHVSTDGDDTNGDGSKKLPYKTIAKAVNIAINGDKIYIDEGEYTLTPINEAGLDDRGKALEIYGENEKTILKYKGSTTTGRDGPAVQISNKNTIVRNLTYIFEPKNSTTNYNVPIFKYSKGSVKNVFFRIITRKASHTYYQCTPIVENCTFYHDMGSVYGNYDGTASFINIATNVTTQGANTNIITESFGTKDMSLSDLLNASKNNSAFNMNKVGVFYGDYAWK